MYYHRGHLDLSWKSSLPDLFQQDVDRLRINVALTIFCFELIFIFIPLLARFLLKYLGMGNGDRFIFAKVADNPTPFQPFEEFSLALVRSMGDFGTKMVFFQRCAFGRQGLINFWLAVISRHLECDIWIRTRSTLDYLEERCYWVRLFVNKWMWLSLLRFQEEFDVIIFTYSSYSCHLPINKLSKTSFAFLSSCSIEAKSPFIVKSCGVFCMPLSSIHRNSVLTISVL